YAQTSTVILDGTTQTVTQLSQGTTLLNEDFSAYDAYQGGAYETVPPAGWIVENNGETADWRFSGSFFGSGPGATDGDGHAYRRWIDGDFAEADVWLFTSGIQMDTDATYEISLDYGTIFNSSREDFDITLSTGQTAGASHIIVRSYTDIGSDTWLNDTISNITVPSSGTYYLGIHSKTAMVSGDDSLSIDDIVITELQSMSFYNLEVNSSTAAAFGQNLVVNNQLQVNPNGVLDLSGITATAEKTVINNGTIQESKNAAGGTTTDFIMIENAAGDTTTYYGVQLIDPAASMGSTTVALAGGQNCGLNLAKLINRCYNITPTTNQSATIRFYFSEADRNGQDASTSNAWHWNGSAWVGASSTDGYVQSEATSNCLTANGLGCYIEAAAVTDYSAFALAVSQPEIQVLDDGADVASGMGTVDLGSTTISNPITKDIIIANVGLTDLTLSNLSLPSGFSQIGTISDTVTAGTATTLTIQLDASAVAFYTGTVTLNTNDSDENPFSFTVEGNVTATPEPEIQLFDGFINILDGSGQVDFGTTIFGEPVTKLLTVKNVGTAALTLGDLNVPAGYSGQFASTTVAPSDSTVFTLTLTAASPGIFSGTVAFDNTDVSESLYDFTVTGNVVDTTAPEIAVLDGTTPLASGSSLVNMGVTSLGNPVIKSFTVQNNGNGNLELNNLVVSGGGFGLVSNFSNTTVTPGNSTTFAVQFNAAAVGMFNGAVSFDTNDEDENPFTFDLTAEAEVKLYLPVILLP
ncbi:MAG: choice-of-anchor D domain-containing protein, partial [Anaerolineales bacterium]|nr:choice-of-anchor D domain-containing protein [Anaerolineales bacterium]